MEWQKVVTIRKLLLPKPIHKGHTQLFANLLQRWPHFQITTYIVSLHLDSLSFHLSHQRPQEGMCHFLCSKSDTFAPNKWHFYFIESDTCPTEVVYGSNESLYYPDKELGLNLKWRHLCNWFQKSCMWRSIQFQTANNALSHIDGI